MASTETSATRRPSTRERSTSTAPARSIAAASRPPRPRGRLPRARRPGAGAVASRRAELCTSAALLHPRVTLSDLEIPDDALPALRCRAANRYLARLFAGMED